MKKREGGFAFVPLCVCDSHLEGRKGQVGKYLRLDKHSLDTSSVNEPAKVLVIDRFACVTFVVLPFVIFSCPGPRK